MAFPHRPDPDDRARQDRIARELFESLAPIDPFVGDDDPSANLDREPDPEPLDDESKQMIIEDLHDLDGFQELLEPRGVRGILMNCDSCEETHFYEWEIMRSNLLNLLQHHQAHVHEPPFKPKPEEFVTWDYAAGYADAVIELSSDDS